MEWQVSRGGAGSLKKISHGKPGPHKPRNRNLTAPFVGVDGEGGNIDGSHEYLLLRVGPDVLHTGRPLTAKQCLGFLADRDTGPKAPIYVAYFFDYDVTMMLRKLPHKVLVNLMDREKRTKILRQGGRKVTYTKPITWCGFHFDYMPGKEFKVRRSAPVGEAKDGSPKFAPYVVVSDVGSFFQCRFIKTIKDWEIGSAVQHEQIAAGKDMRADFGVMTPEIIEYNELEMILLAALMDSFRSVCIEVGYIPKKWQGPGYLASAMMDKHGIVKNDSIPCLTPPDVFVGTAHSPERDAALAKAWEVLGLRDAAQAAYYGGRSEVSVIGRVPGPVYQYDINSAYPHAITQLPCLRHGQFRYVTDPEALSGVLAGGDLFLAHGEFDLGSRLQEHLPAGVEERLQPVWNAFPHRNGMGNISFPTRGMGWYWSPEVKASQHQQFKPDAAYVYSTTCGCRPFDFVPGVYAERKRLGKSAKGKVLKTALNSIYGKLCQSVGHPKYANPIYASLITSLTRAMIMAFIHSVPCASQPLYACGNNVLMVATDGIFTRQPIPGDSGFTVGGGLGEWDLAVHEHGLFIAMPGIYFSSDGATRKTRGIPQSSLAAAESDIRRVFRQMYLDHRRGEAGWDTIDEYADRYQVRVPIVQFLGIRSAVHRSRVSGRIARGVGQWDAVETGGVKGRILDLKSYHNKRIAYGMGPLVAREGHILTWPREYKNATETVPYSKQIGGEIINLDPDYYLDSDQPDWGVLLHTGEDHA